MSALRCEAIALLGSRRTSVGADRSGVSAKHQTDRNFAGGCRRSIRPWTHRDVPFGGPADGPRASPLRSEPDLDRPPAHEQRHPGASRPGEMMIPEAIGDLQERVPPLGGPADGPWASPAQEPHTNAIEIKWFSVPSALSVVLFFYTGAFRLDHRGPREHRERRMGRWLRWAPVQAEGRPGWPRFTDGPAGLETCGTADKNVCATSNGRRNARSVPGFGSPRSGLRGGLAP